MLKIRLMRIGGKQKPFYRVVIVDERAKRTGGYVELVGTYNPLPKEIKLKQDRIDYWTRQGAQGSTGYLRIIGKAPQRLPRKPKKEKKTEEPKAASVSTPAPETSKPEEPAQEKTTEPAPAETEAETPAPAKEEEKKE